MLSARVFLVAGADVVGGFSYIVERNEGFLGATNGLSVRPVLLLLEQ